MSNSVNMEFSYFKEIERAVAAVAAIAVAVVMIAYGE